MSRYEKLIRKFIERPESLRYHDIEVLLIYLGFIKQQGKGSHIKFKHSDIKKDFSIPVHNGDCKKNYKKELYKLLKKESII